MKTLLQTLVVIGLLATASFAYADDEPESYNFDFTDIEEIEAERYEQIEGKWEIEVEFDDEDFKFYVYNIDTETELFSEIAQAIEEKFNFDISSVQVESVLEFDEDDMDEDDTNDDKENKELELEAERYKSVEGKWEVEYELGDTEEKFYVYEVTNEADLVSKITEYLQKNLDIDISESEVDEALEIDEDEEQEDEKNDKKDKSEKDKEVKTITTSPQIQIARDAQILALQEQIALLMELVIELLSRQLSS